MPKRTKKNRYMKKGGLFMGTAPPPAAPPAAPEPAKPKSAFSQFFSSVTGAAKLAKDTAQETANFAAKTAADTAHFAADAASKTANFAADTASKTADVAAQNAVPKIPVGGRRCRKRGGSDKSYFSLTNLASVANPISGILTAKPQVWVGGKTRKTTCNKRHKHTKSCKSKTKKGNRKKRSRKSKFPFSASLKRLIKM